MAIITIEKIDSFKTSDGRVFFKRHEAAAHEVKLQVHLLIAELGICSGGDWSPDMVASAILENTERVRDAINIYDDNKT